MGVKTDDLSMQFQSVGWGEAIARQPTLRLTFLLHNKSEYAVTLDRASLDLEVNVSNFASSLGEHLYIKRIVIGPKASAGLDLKVPFRYEMAQWITGKLRGGYGKELFWQANWYLLFLAPETAPLEKREALRARVASSDWEDLVRRWERDREGPDG